MKPSFKRSCVCETFRELATGTTVIVYFKRGNTPIVINFLCFDPKKGCVTGIDYFSGAVTTFDCNRVSLIQVPSGPCMESTTTFMNTTSIAIPAEETSGPANPYPSTINVSGLVGPVVKVTVQLNNLSHTFPEDIDILLVGPDTSQNAIIMSDVGGGGDVVNVTLLLDDDAPSPLPDGSPLVSGTFQPANYAGFSDDFPSPAPTPAGGSALSVFNGSNPNGTWSLYIVDNAGGDLGSLAGGWSLNITSCEF